MIKGLGAEAILIQDRRERKFPVAGEVLICAMLSVFLGISMKRWKNQLRNAGKIRFVDSE